MKFISVLFILFYFSLVHGLKRTLGLKPYYSFVYGAADMEEEIAGFAVYRWNASTNKWEYLMVEKKNEIGKLTPPKGHVENTEIPMEAAYRETEEETSLLAQHYEVLFGLFEYFEYYTKDDIKKKVSLWPACLSTEDQPIILSEENGNYYWLGEDDTIRMCKDQYKQAMVNIIQKVYCKYNNC